MGVKLDRRQKKKTIKLRLFFPLTLYILGGEEAMAGHGGFVAI